MRLAPAALVAAIGCGGTPDRDRYVAAMALDGEAGHAACAEIRDRALRSECQLHNAAGTAASGDVIVAQALCAEISDVLWAEECFFLTTDESHLTGDDAIEACRRAGRFRENCLGHAIGREVQTTEKRYAAVGLEDELEREIAAIVRRYKPGAPEEMRQVSVDRMMASILSKRWEGGAFDAATCGVARRELCRLSYRTRLDAAPLDVPLEQLCAGEPDRDAVIAARAPHWVDEPETAAIASEAWAMLCDDLRSGRVVRDARHSIGVPPRDALPGERPPRPR